YVTQATVTLPKGAQLGNAMQQWYQPVTKYGLNTTDTHFTDPRLQSFANIAHYKTTAVGCHYAKCRPPDVVVIGCAYNNPYDSAKRLIYPRGYPCTTDADCTIFSPSTCNRALQLCVTTAQNPVNPNPPNPPAPPVQGGTMCQNTEMTDATRKKVRAMHNWRRSQLALGNIKNGLNNYNCPKAANMYKMNT
ncbi:hypothetical protein ANCDUO_21455, partial [Ancylostoma duodenale]